MDHELYKEAEVFITLTIRPKVVIVQHWCYINLEVKMCDRNYSKVNDSFMDLHSTLYKVSAII